LKQVPKTSLNKARGRGKRFWGLAAEYGEPVIAIIAGLVLAFLGLTGGIDGDDLAAATLVVLSLLALSLLRERLLRIEANENIETLGTRLDQTTDAVNAIQSGNPYSVLCHETTWDIVKPDGSLVYATRIKKIRIDQNNVFALRDFASGDGQREFEYSPGEPVGEFIGEGHKHNLIALGRIYYRGEHLDFTVKRTVRDGFVGKHESVGVDTSDATELMRLKILWPAGHPPSALRLGRATPSKEWRNENVLDKLEEKNGRPVYEVEIHAPAKGGSTTIEWEWEPVVEKGSPAAAPRSP
jgi:hypothetical protein